MKREIKFRGKRCDNQEWVYGFLRERGFGSYITFSHFEQTDDKTLTRIDEEVKVLTYSVGQCTNIIEKNGEEIYENDIVKWGHVKGGEERPIRVAIVEMNPDIQLVCTNVKGFDGMPYIFGWGNFAYSKNFDKYGELIGNTFDNRDLLEKGGNEC